MMTSNAHLPGHYHSQISKMPGFFFRKRIERIDWKRLASVDVCRVVSQMDIDALQENLPSVAFCDINSEIDTRYVDTNLIKLFQLAQLLIEYLLYSQDYLTNTLDTLRKENEVVKKEREALKLRLEQQSERLTSTRKECHRRRLLLLAQQRLMNNGPQSYFRCPHCPKAFINASFLNAHLFRRHAEVVSALTAVDLNRSDLGALQNLVTDRVNQDNKSNKLTTNLEQQIHEVLAHLKSQAPPPAPATHPAAVQTSVEAEVSRRQSPAQSPDATWRRRTAELERQLSEERERLRQVEERNRTWQETVNSQHKIDVERVKEMFEMELRNLREENLETQKELMKLRLKKATVNGFGDVEDDVPRQLERQVRSLEVSPKRSGHMVQLVEEVDNVAAKARERLRQSQSPGTPKKKDPDISHKSIQSSTPVLSIDPLEGIPHHKDQLEGFKANADAMRRLRSEVEALLAEQLADHEVESDANGLSKGRFNETMDSLSQERQHLLRKYPNFAEIRASIARKVDRLALISLHRKREHNEVSVAPISETQKRARASRTIDRVTSAASTANRPTSGRPASLSSLASAQLSPIVERRRRNANATGAAINSNSSVRGAEADLARASKNAPSKNSLFENSEEEDEDEEGVVTTVELKRNTEKRTKDAVGLTTCVDVESLSTNTVTSSKAPLNLSPITHEAQYISSKATPSPKGKSSPEKSVSPETKSKELKAIQEVETDSSVEAEAEVVESPHRSVHDDDEDKDDYDDEDEEDDDDEEMNEDVFPDKKISTNPSIKFSVESIAGKSGKNPPKVEDSRFVWNDLDSEEEGDG